jgi:hypothetical protein
MALPGAQVPRSSGGAVLHRVVHGLALLLVVASPRIAAAAEPVIGTSKTVAATAQQDSASKAEKNMLITPFIAPGYTPEMGGLLTAGALISFKTNPLFKRNAPTVEVQRSTVNFNGSYSTTSAINANARLTSYLRGDELRINADVNFKDMPDEYWGVGIDAGHAPESDSTTSYQRTSWAVTPRIMRRVHRNGLLGVAFDINGLVATELSAGVADDPNLLATGSSNHSAGAGFLAQFDTRDMGLNAWKGIYVNAQAIFYGDFLGSSQTYQMYDIDYRQYHALGREGRTLAWTLRSRVGVGNVPWPEMSQLGTSNDLRGYRLGRYRDKTMLYGIVEFRNQFTSKSRKTGLSRHGVIGWIGAGSVAGDLSAIHEWLPNFGLGYRLEMQPRTSVRLDVGFGKEYGDAEDKFGPSVYFNFGESF